MLSYVSNRQFRLIYLVLYCFVCAYFIQANRFYLTHGKYYTTDIIEPHQVKGTYSKDFANVKHY